nr:hypothetical protein [Bacteroidota bacterium]
MIKITTILLAIILLFGCAMHNEKTIKLPSKIYSFNMQQPSIIYYKGERIDFYVKRKTEKHQSVLGWLNVQDLLLMKESSKDIHGYTFYDHLYLVDINENIVDSIYAADVSKGEIISGVYISPNDSILLIHLHYKPLKKNAEGWFYSPLDILVIDFKNKEIIDRLENFHTYNIHYRQNSSCIFSPDGQQFVYSISDERNWYTDDREKYALLNKKDNGIYIYDLVNKSHQQITDEGVDPIWSPNGDIIGYSNNKEVWFYSVKSKKKKLFYKTKNNQTVVNICWTPDGENLYIMTREKSNLYPRGKLSHRLINIKNKTETVNGVLMKLGLSFYWK